MGDFFGHPEHLLSDRDKRLFEKHNAPNQKGITSMACMYNSDHIAATPAYLEGYENTRWKKDGCQNAMCRHFNTSECTEAKLCDGCKDFDPKKDCVYYKTMGR